MSAMRTSARLTLLLALAALAVPTAAPAGAQEPAIPSAIRLELPGPLLGAAVLPSPGGGGRSSLALVIGDRPSEGEGEGEASDGARPSRRLYRYDLASRTFAPWTAEPLPEGDLRLASRAADGPWTGVLRFGSLDIVPIPSGAGAEPPVHFDLPRRAERRSWGLRLTSPGALPFERAGTPDAPPCFATEPEASGPRLRVLLLCPGAERNGAPEETWSLLPGDETVTEARFGLLAGAPALAVLTRTKLGLFVKQDLRVFALAGSRSRLGAGPILATKTDCPIWRRLELGFADADGDGRQDVVLVCEKGLVDPELRVELHRGSPSGGFEKVRITELEGEFDSWSYRDDWTGDGLADLVTLHEGRIELRAGSSGRRPIDREASWAASLPAREEEPEDGSGTSVQIGGTDGAKVQHWRGGEQIITTADLDGDGRPEVVVHRPGEGGGELLILRR
jgi:hypothetical protein